MKQENLIFSCDSLDLFTNLKDIYRASSKDANRHSLNGFELITSMDNIHLTATDGNVLASREVKGSVHSEVHLNVFLSYEKLKEIKLLSKKELKSSLFLEDKSVLLKTEKGECRLPIIPTPFPSYQNIGKVDQDYKSITFDNLKFKEFIKEIKREEKEIKEFFTLSGEDYLSTNTKESRIFNLFLEDGKIFFYKQSMQGYNILKEASFIENFNLTWIKSISIQNKYLEIGLTKGKQTTFISSDFKDYVITSQSQNENNFISVCKNEIAFFPAQIEIEKQKLKIEELKNQRVYQEKTLVFTCNTKEFSKAFFDAYLAVSKDENRAMLTGVETKIVGDMLQFTGTDGNRLSVRTVKGRSYCEDLSEFEAPMWRNDIENRKYAILKGEKANLKKLKDILKNNGKLTVSYSKNELKKGFYLFETDLGSAEIMSGSGNFPKWEQLIPENESLKFKLKLNNSKFKEFIKGKKGISITFEKEKGLFWAYLDRCGEGIPFHKIDFIESSDLLENEKISIDFRYLIDSIDFDYEFSEFGAENCGKSVLKVNYQNSLSIVMPRCTERFNLKELKEKYSFANDCKKSKSLIGKVNKPKLRLIPSFARIRKIKNAFKRKEVKQWKQVA